ncbi:HesB/IscA family protein [Paenibacillus roseipurpureus]|uniref:Iron-sulfur cluster assembly accessory protein n=1 Tax=Paenibacillus roseopurpureus TaxID=2918901 RepID=A0AA96LSB2_9BACL|nr:iron-sulfur cluster assembly accessory protein [Paenibacillus sp. MBLB1832]WNR45641.1 iron-sulfur cluster assembly accessory protein [Paenibacillus sp. MBLB1832]
MINISESASDKIKELLASEESTKLFLRLGVKAGGCSGFSYGMGFDDDQKADDKEFIIHGLKVVVDEESAKYLYGVQIDFEDKGMGGGFTINNPNAVASCGCGSSFKPADYEGTPEPCDDKVEA